MNTGGILNDRNCRTGRGYDGMRGPTYTMWGPPHPSLTVLHTMWGPPHPSLTVLHTMWGPIFSSAKQEWCQVSENSSLE